MKNKHERMKEAQAFANKKSAYIHVEVRNGKHDGTVLAGDPAFVMIGILSVLGRLAEISGMPVEEHIKILSEMWQQTMKRGDPHDRHS